MIRITRTIIPIPPIQCVKLRQNKMDFGSASMSVKMEEPVVVNPDTDSKNALINEGMLPEKTYGRLPIKVIKIQLAVTVKYASFIFNSEFCISDFETRNKNELIANAIIKEIKKGNSGSV
jgi:hypothetical protein